MPTLEYALFSYQIDLKCRSPSLAVIDGLQCWINAHPPHTMMQKDESSRRPRFILPKPVYRHEHNIRFLTSHPLGKRRTLSYDERSSPDSLGLKIENFKRVLLKYQMKNRVDDKMLGTEGDGTATAEPENDYNGSVDLKSQHLVRPLCYPADAEKGGETIAKQAFVFAKPYVQSRPYSNKPGPHRIAMGTSKPNTRPDGGRSESNSNHVASNSNRDSSQSREDRVPKLLLGSRHGNASSGAKISFFKGGLQSENSGISWRMQARGKEDAVGVLKTEDDVSPSSHVSGIRFFDHSEKSSEFGSKVLNGHNEGNVFVFPRSSDARNASMSPLEARISAQRQTQEPTQPRNQRHMHEAVKPHSPYRLGNDVLKKELGHAQIGLTSPERHATNAINRVRPNESFYEMEKSAVYQYSHVPANFQPLRKLARLATEDQVRRIIKREDGVDDLGTEYSQQSCRTNVVSSPVPAKDSIASHDDSSGHRSFRPIFTSGRPTAIIKAGQRYERGDFYKDRPGRGPPLHGCNCTDCQSAYSIYDRKEDLSPGCIDNSRNENSPPRNTNAELAYRNGETYFKNHFSVKQVNFKGHHYEDSSLLFNRQSFDKRPTLERPTFERPNFDLSSLDRSVSSEFYNSRDRSSVERSRNKILSCPVSGFLPEKHIYLNRASAGDANADRKARDAIYDRWSQERFKQEGTRASLSECADASYRESNFSRASYPEPAHSTNYYSLFTSSSNMSPECGSPSSEKSRHPPRLIGSNARAAESCRQRDRDKGYSEPQRQVDTNSPFGGIVEMAPRTDLLRPGMKRKSHVVVTYSYPRQQRQIEKGEDKPRNENVSYTIRERTFLVEDDSVTADASRPGSKESVLGEAANRSGNQQNSPEVDVKVSYLLILSTIVVVYLFINVIIAIIDIFNTNNSCSRCSVPGAFFEI